MKIEDVQSFDDLKIKVAELEHDFNRDKFNMADFEISYEYYSKYLNRQLELCDYIEKMREKKKNDRNKKENRNGKITSKIRDFPNEDECQSKKSRRSFFLNAVDSCKDSECGCHKIYASERHNVLVKSNVSYFNGEKPQEKSIRYFETHKTAKKYADDVIFYSTWPNGGFSVGKTIIINIEEIHQGINN